MVLVVMYDTIQLRLRPDLNEIDTEVNAMEPKPNLDVFCDPCMGALRGYCGFLSKEGFYVKDLLSPEEAVQLRTIRARYTQAESDEAKAHVATLPREEAVAWARRIIARSQQAA